jgi:hypothetical protein
MRLSLPECDGMRDVMMPCHKGFSIAESWREGAIQAMRVEGNPIAGSLNV